MKIDEAHTVKTYKELPKHEREKFGFYIRPSLYAWDSLDDININGFDEFYKSEYPIQSFFRITIHDFFSYKKYALRMRWYKLKRFFRSENNTTVKLIPRERMDKYELIPHMILAMTVEFQKEANGSLVDYIEHKEQASFKKWLDKTCATIQETLPYIEKRIDRAYVEIDSSLRQKFEDKYKYVIRWEDYRNKLIKDICKDVIDHLENFWT
jgi:hypothetical protein